MPKKKIFYVISVFFIVFLTIAGINVRAHPPSDMTLEFDSNTNALTVTITHIVSDNTSHYVLSVVINVNGSVDQTHPYTSQPDTVEFVYIYTVVTSAGSTINVLATCSEGGTISRTLGGTPTGGAIPGYMGLYLVLVVSVITLLMTFRKKFKRI